MTFKNQQDRFVFGADTLDAAPTIARSIEVEEGALVQFNFFVKAQDDAGRSMNFVLQGSAIANPRF
jgi:hypothetical protein